MNQIERITKMEENLDAVTNAQDELLSALENYEKVLDNFKELSAYYGSEDWLKDFNDDNEGKFPKDLKRGVLSEDAVYDLVSEDKYLLNKMLKLASKMTDRD